MKLHFREVMHEIEYLTINTGVANFPHYLVSKHLLYDDLEYNPIYFQSAYVLNWFEKEI